MPAPPSILALLERYEVHRSAYLRDEANYNEAKVRRDYIEPLFRALNWDIDNNKGFSEAYREVMLEEPIRIRDRTQFFDYTFRIGGLRKFIVEAKKPAVSIKDNADAALQIRWYAWNAKLSLSILTNFEEFAIYDCARKPKTTDHASDARIEYFTYKDIPAKWDWIVSTFSQDAILKGSFDKYAETTKGKKGTASVDDDFLNEIEEWRDLLAKNIAIRNPVSVEELNAIVQRTIDRLIFLRICEDRGIENYGTLQQLMEGDGVYARLCNLFRHADEKYNSGLFHFQQEADVSEPPDTLSLSVVIDDKVLKAIIRRLYYPECPYIFSVIPPAILGHVYEQFLGKVIRLTEGHQAKVEYKPEVKKAGGVYYTPQYIVEYIVRHTVGELVKDKSPRDVAKLRILDPACGSGSFLIGAYQFLLTWHRDWYIANLVPKYIEKKESVLDPEVLALLPESAPRGKKKLAQVEMPVYRAGTKGVETRTRSDWRLTTAEKKRILLNNIFGVDIDTQAVEVTKLSLLLKVLEEENEENIDKQLKLFAERALPSLDQNIRCGNSLIGMDILTPEMPADEVRRINPFDWEREFADVMKAGGFDVVIGNPPYVRQELLKEQKKYFETHYVVYQGAADLYAYFFEKGISLLRPKGLFSFIVANKWMRASYGKPLRKYLLTKQIEEIIDFGDLPVFKTATTYPCIIRVSQETPVRELCSVKVNTLDFSSLEEYVISNWYPLNQKSLTDDGWSLGNDASENLLAKLRKNGHPLEEYIKGEIYRGIVTGNNEAFVIDQATKEKLIAEDPKSAEIIKPYIAGRDVKRYQSLPSGKFVIFTKRGIKIKDYPAIERYLRQFKNQLMPKPDNWSGDEWVGRKPGKYEWFEIQDSIDYYNQFEKPKIVYLVFQVKCAFTFDPDGKFYPNNAVWIIPSDDKYLLGILNSKLGWNLISNYCTQIQSGYQLIFKYLGQIPIRTINFSDAADKARHDRMVSLVTQMLDFNKRLQEARLEHDKLLLQRQIEATDASIDSLVYELYGLTDEEIKIVAGNAGK